MDKPKAKAGPKTKPKRNNNLVYGNNSKECFGSWFIKKKRKVGRPKGSNKKNKRSKQTNISNTDKAKITKALNAKTEINGISLKPKQARLNWNKEPYSTLMKKMVNCWLQKGGLFRKGDTVRKYCERLNISRSVFQRHLAIAKKEKEVTRRRGRAPLISREKQDYIIDFVAASDEMNSPLGRQKIIDAIVQTFNGDLNSKRDRERAGLCWHQTILPRAQREKRLTGRIKAQAGSDSRTAAGNVDLQKHWHDTIDKAFHILKTRNTPMVTNFEAVMHHFVFNLDEESIMASGYENRVYGSTAKKKHDNKSGSSRKSITVIRCGSAAGNSGPSFFLLTGKKVRPAYTPSRLEAYGAKPNSKVVMTPNAFLNDDAWSEIVTYLIKGLRSMPVVKDYPDAWIFLSLDGYKSHTKQDTDCIAKFYAAKILVAVENRDSSHINQVKLMHSLNHGT